jgi:hypothetical protein
MHRDLFFIRKKKNRKECLYPLLRIIDLAKLREVHKFFREFADPLPNLGDVLFKVIFMG